MFFSYQPKAIIFESTLECTLNCAYCYNVHKCLPYSRKELDTQTTVSMIQKIIRQSKCKTFVITGGEPYLRKDIRTLIETVHKEKVKLYIITNGSLLTKDIVIHALTNGVKMFELPLLADSADMHDELTRCPKHFSAFDNSVNAGLLIHKNGGEFVNVFVATKKNIHLIKKTLELSYAIGAKAFLFNRFTPCGEGSRHINDLLATPDQLINALEIANDFAQKNHFEINCAINIPPCIIHLKKYRFIKFTGCGIGTKQNYYVLDARGNIRQCTLSPHIIGNIFNEPLGTMYENEASKKLMNAVPDFCRPCKLVKICQGCCKASAQSCYNDPGAEEPFLRTYKTKPI